MLDSLLDATVTDVQSLGIALNGVTAPVVKRKGPKRQPDVDREVQITVCKSTVAEEQAYLSFGRVTTYYFIEITVIAPNDRDYATNLPVYTQWREQIRLHFLPPLLESSTVLGLAGVWDVRVMPDDFLDREEMANMYDAMTLVLKIGATA